MPREEFNAQRRAWRKQNPEAAKARDARYRQLYREKRRQYCRIWNEANKEQKKALNAAWYAANREAALATTAAWRKANPDKMLAAVRAWQRAHPGKARAIRAARRAAEVRATPVWADHEKIAALYAEAERRGLQVDHIVPLRSKLVCGLHVHNNLQLLPAEENVRKGNRHWPDMPK